MVLPQPGACRPPRHDPRKDVLLLRPRHAAQARHRGVDAERRVAKVPGVRRGRCTEALDLRHDGGACASQVEHNHQASLVTANIVRDTDNHTAAPPQAYTLTSRTVTVVPSAVRPVLLRTLIPPESMSTGFGPAPAPNRCRCSSHRVRTASLN